MASNDHRTAGPGVIVSAVAVGVAIQGLQQGLLLGGTELVVNERREIVDDALAEVEWLVGA
jgi:hypothetical protein